MMIDTTTMRDRRVIENMKNEGAEMEFIKRCKEYAGKELFNMLGTFSANHKALTEEINTLSFPATRDGRAAILESLSETATDLLELAGSRALARSRFAEQTSKSLRDAADLVLEEMVKVSAKRAVDDYLNEAFESVSGMFLKEATVGPGSEYHTHFQDYLKKHPKAKGKMGNLTHDERKQVFKDAGASWRAKKAKGAKKPGPDVTKGAVDRHDPHVKKPDVKKPEEKKPAEKSATV